MNSAPTPPHSRHPAPAPNSSTGLPLDLLLGHTATVVAAVLAGRSLTDLLAAVPAAARPGTQALAFHVMRWLGGAMAARAALASRQPPPAVDALLITALALLWPRAQAPYADHTLVDQAVACAHRRTPASAGFVNAILRRFLRERERLVPDLEATDPVARHQHPRWWIERLQRDWPEQWTELLAADQPAAPLMLRVNLRRSSVADYLARLTAAGIAAQPFDAQGIVLDQAVPVHLLPGFADGLVSVQDRSAQQAAPLLLGHGADRLPAGARVLDACAAPGGKTAHLLELAELDLLAIDSDATRLKRVGETLARLGLQAELRAGDAGQPAQWWDGHAFDAILLDAPCSAAGIVRRHPDVRWLRRASDIDALARIQAQLLDALWPLLKPGGRLVYATCSVFRSEGVHQIAAFLQRHPEACTPPAPGHLLPVADNQHQSGAAPAVLGDGFYYARLDRPAT
ncbi:MAG: 16S rRNA (cytosine(967)-C(5))-methyltransferase RsmB [Leptothrix sp. (in: b-proteobacteria)]